MTFELQYQISRDLYTKSFRSLWLGRTIGYHIGISCLGIFGLYQLAAGESVGFGGFCVGLTAYHLYAWLGNAKDQTLIPKELEGVELKGKVSDAGIRFESPFRTTELTWKGIPWLRKYPDFWIMGFDRTGWYYTVLPVNHLSTEQKAFIEDRIRENCGLVS